MHQKKWVQIVGACYFLINVFIVISCSIAWILVLNVALFAPTAGFMCITFDKFTVSTIDLQSYAIKISNFVFDKPIKCNYKSGSGDDESNISYHGGIHLYDSSVSKKQNRIVRLCYINYQLHQSKMRKDDMLFEFLAKHEKQLYLTVTPKDIRYNKSYVKAKTYENVYFDKNCLICTVCFELQSI